MVKKSMFLKVLPYIFGASMLVSTSLGAQELKNNSISNNSVDKKYLVNSNVFLSHTNFEKISNYNWRDSIFTSSKNKLLITDLTGDFKKDATSNYFTLNNYLNLEQPAKKVSSDVRINLSVCDKKYFAIASSVVAPNYYPGMVFSIYKK